MSVQYASHEHGTLQVPPSLVCPPSPITRSSSASQQSSVGMSEEIPKRKFLHKTASLSTIPRIADASLLNEINQFRKRGSGIKKAEVVGIDVLSTAFHNKSRHSTRHPHEP